MADFVMMNRQAVRQTGLYRRTIRQTDGPPLEEVELVVILRGGMAHRAFLALIAGRDIAFEIPNAIRLHTTITASTWSSSGAGESAAFRHDLTLRETAASAAARAAAARDAAALADEAAADDEAAEAVAPEADDPDPTAPADLSKVGIGGGGAGWATALRQMTGRDGAEAKPEEPLAPAELAGVEAVLVGLRLEALLEALDRARVLRRSDVDDAFLRLIAERFVAEATPVVGEAVAKRAATNLIS